MPAVDPRSSLSGDRGIQDTLSIDSINALLDRSSALLNKDPFRLHRLSKIHRESVSKVATEVAHILTRKRSEIITERKHIQRLLEKLEFQDSHTCRNRKLDCLKRRVNKMMDSADRDITKQQFYMKKCSLYELDDTLCIRQSKLTDLRHAVQHDMDTLATPSVSKESIAKSQASTHSRASTNARRNAKPEEQMINETVFSTWAVSRCLSHVACHASTPINIRNGADDLLTMIERMATLLSSALDEQATDLTRRFA